MYVCVIFPPQKTVYFQILKKNHKFSIGPTVLFVVCNFMTYLEGKKVPISIRSIFKKSVCFPH